MLIIIFFATAAAKLIVSIICTQLNLGHLAPCSWVPVVISLNCRLLNMNSTNETLLFDGFLIMYNLCVFTCIIVMFVFHCTHVRMSYVLNSYLLTYLLTYLTFAHHWVNLYVALYLLSNCIWSETDRRTDGQNLLYIYHAIVWRDCFVSRYCCCCCCWWWWWWRRDVTLFRSSGRHQYQVTAVITDQPPQPYRVPHRSVLPVAARGRSNGDRLHSHSWNLTAFHGHLMRRNLIKLCWIFNSSHWRRR